MIFNRLWNRHRRLLFIVVLFAAPLVPLMLLKVELPRLNLYDRLSMTVLQPVANVSNLAWEGLVEVWRGYVALVGVVKENQKLYRENQTLRAQILEMEEAKRENQRLNEYLKIPQLTAPEYLGAKVVGEDAAGDSLTYFVNLGSKQGVMQRMAVITPEGVVGTISRVYGRSSMVTSMVDPGHKVDGIIERSRARFIVEGMGKNLLGRLKYLDRAEDVRVGDRVLTSGLDGVFPKGLVLGYVVSVRKPRSGVNQEAELRPAVDPGTLEQVMLVRYREGWDFSIDPSLLTGDVTQGAR